VKLIVREGASLEDIKAILCNPSIYDTIIDDDTGEFEDFEKLLNNDIAFHTCYVNNELIALACYHKERDGVKYHPYVLPEYRNKYARKFAEQSLSLIRTQPIYVEIPTLYKHVIKFALSFGFKLIEIKKNNHNKNNVNYDSNVMRLNKWVS
jgi:hypothetical protein